MSARSFNLAAACPVLPAGVPVQPLPPLGAPMPHHPAAPSLPVHPGALPPGAPVWGPPAAAPMQQQPQQPGARPSWGRGAPVPGPAGLAPGAPASSLGSPLNPHSAVFTPSGRASPVLSATATAGEPAAQPQQPAPSETPHAADGGEQPVMQHQAQPPAQQPAEQRQQEAVVLVGEARAAAVQVAVGAAAAAAAAAVPVGQTAHPAADQQLKQPAQPAAEPAQQAVQQQAAGEQQQQAVAPVTVPVQPTAQAAASEEEAAAPAAAAGLSEPPAADVAAAPAGQPAAPKSWAALASATPAAAAVQFRPHTAPQRAPGQAALAPLQQRQQPQEHYPRGHDRDGHGGRGRGRGRGEGGRGRGGYPHYSSRGAGDSLPHHHQQPPQRQQRSSDSLPHHHHQRSVGTVSVGSSGGGAPSSGSGTPKAARVPAAAPVDGSLGTPAPATPVLPAGQPLPEVLWPLCRGADLAAAAAAPSSLRVQPRGLLNPGNLCFMNSIMQVCCCNGQGGAAALCAVATLLQCPVCGSSVQWMRKTHHSLPCPTPELCRRCWAAADSASC